MRRAVILILTMTLLGISTGLWMENSLRDTCWRYMGQAASVRQLVEERRLSEALEEQALLFAAWQGDVQRLNALVSHHHTRAVDEALLTLTTALEHGWQDEALLALDAVQFALNDLETDMTLRWENVL